MCLNTGTPKNMNFSFEIYGISMVLSVPILKHFRVFQCLNPFCENYLTCLKCTSTFWPGKFSLSEVQSFHAKRRMNVMSKAPNLLFHFNFPQ